ncbi:MAG: CRISPR-associated endoribonuclease Cas6 [bacterium]
MRIGVVYKIDKLPIEYRSCFFNLIKEAIKQEAPELYEQFYLSNHHQTKPFCFSVFFECVQISADILTIRRNTRLYLSTLDISEDPQATGIKIYNGLLKVKTMDFPLDETLHLINIFPLNEKNKTYFTQGEICFKTMSPIIVVDRDKKPVLHPQTKNEISHFSGPENTISLDESRFLKELIFSLKELNITKLEFIPVDLKKEVIKYTISDHLKTKAPMKLIGFKGKFILKGNPDDLYKIYQLGLGFRRNQGFGMVEVV